MWFRRQEKKEEKLRFEAICSSLFDGVYTVGKDKKILTVNKGVERITGFKKEELIGRQCKDLFTHTDEKDNILCDFNCIVDEVMNTAKVVPPRKALTMTSAGKRIPILIAAAPMKNEKGNIEGAAIFFRDITNEVKIEELKSDFIAVVSHELRIPLTTIKESIDLILDGVTGPTTGNQRNVLSNAKSEIERLNRLLEEVLDVSKIEASRLRVRTGKLDLVDVIKKAELSYQPLANKKGISFSVDIASGIPYVIGDPDKVYEVFSNLLSNAFKFTPSGGSITINCRPHSENFIGCSIKDSGCGIPRHALNRLFGKFEQLGLEEDKRRGGSGLGLYITRTIIKKLGGNIWAESEEGVGSTFTFTLPVYKEELELQLELSSSVEEVRAMQAGLVLFMLEVGLKGPEFERLYEISNDTVGRPGDKVIKQYDSIYILLGSTNKKGAMSFKERLKSEFQKADFDYSKVIRKFGVASYPDDALTYQELIVKAKANTTAF
jgi:PAS domain S-box-containing protein